VNRCPSTCSLTGARCVKEVHKFGSHAWHRDRNGEHVTVVWWPTAKPKRTRKKVSA